MPNDSSIRFLVVDDNADSRLLRSSASVAPESSPDTSLSEPA